MTYKLADCVQFQVTGIMQLFGASFKRGGVAVFPRMLTEKAASQIWVPKGWNREGTSVLGKKLWDSPERDFRGWGWGNGVHLRQARKGSMIQPERKV